MREQTTKIPFPCFRYRIYLVCTDDLIGTADKLAKQGKLRYPHGVDDQTHAFTVRMPNQSYTIIVLNTSATIDEIGHECYHALCNMFRWIGAAHEEEVFAYSLGYVQKIVQSDLEKYKAKALDKTPPV